MFGIKFKAGGFYPFYGQPVAELLNQAMDVAECFGPAGADLALQVLATPHFEAMCAAA